MLSLGEHVRIEEFEGHTDTVIIYVFFVLATFFTEITFLNMIIAIMSDVYDRLRETKHIQALQVKLEMVSDYAGLIQDEERKQDDQVFLFVVTPRE